MENGQIVQYEGMTGIVMDSRPADGEEPEKLDLFLFTHHGQMLENNIPADKVTLCYQSPAPPVPVEDTGKKGVKK